MAYRFAAVTGLFQEPPAGRALGHEQLATGGVDDDWITELNATSGLTSNAVKNFLAWFPNFLPPLPLL